MDFLQLAGETLDGKYRIERELGRGGMGTVYFAIHLGTERPVAVKVITPQFMEKAEFVERFRREAKAAGRLRHPNVVDVTDFGIAETKDGRVAYLVMEYLDGCTLGEILDEEKSLPLSFTLDIIEQVCFAVHEAHGQGIIHRDLKPDNIWLEPNQRGGYTVKVLDFGIAKLEENFGADGAGVLSGGFDSPVNARPAVETLADNPQSETIADNRGETGISDSETAILPGEKGTIIQSPISESATALIESDGRPAGSRSEAELALDGQDTAILPGKRTQIGYEESGTNILSAISATEQTVGSRKVTAALTRVGAVLGTPLYMSPEQCRGEKLSPSSDIYSLAVISYQMLGGKTPFSGDFSGVMQSHKEHAPPPLEAKKIPRKVKQVIHSALSKDINARPQTAQAFASELRSHSEGFARLLQRALVIYSEHLPKFIILMAIASVPSFILALIRIGSGILGSAGIISGDAADVLSGLNGLVAFFVQSFAAAFAVGTVTWMVAQILAAPLRPVSVRAAVKAAWSRWKTFAGTVTATTLISIIGYICCIVPGLYLSTIYMLVAPTVMMEGLKGRAALKRSKELINRSFWTGLAIAILVYLVPIALTGLIAFSVSSFAEKLNFSQKTEHGAAIGAGDAKGEDMQVKIGPGGVQVKEADTGGKDEKDLTPEERQAKTLARIRRDTTFTALLEFTLAPITLLLASLTSVITALMYFKTRQAGGESLEGLLQQFEDTDAPRRKWQGRIRERLEQSGRSTSKS